MALCQLCRNDTQFSGCVVYDLDVCVKCHTRWSAQVELRTLQANQERIVKSLQIQLAKQDQLWAAELGEQLRHISIDALCDLLKHNGQYDGLYRAMWRDIARDATRTAHRETPGLAAWLPETTDEPTLDEYLRTNAGSNPVSVGSTPPASSPRARTSRPRGSGTQPAKHDKR